MSFNTKLYLMLLHKETETTVHSFLYTRSMLYNVTFSYGDEWFSAVQSPNLNLAVVAVELKFKYKQQTTIW